MSQIESIGKNYGMDTGCYSYETDKTGEIISLDLYDPEYYDFQGKENILSFISHFKKLQSLSINIYDYRIDDLSILKNFKFLKSISIETPTTIGDLDCIAHLTELETLIIEQSNISDISILSGMKNLKYLSICNSSISDISPLQDLINLEYIILNDNKIKSITGLNNHKKLGGIYLDNNKISYIDSLSESKLLKYLSIANNEITNVDFLKPCQELELFRAGNNKLENIDFLEGKTKLNHLDISNNPIAVITAITNLKSVTFFGCSNNPLINYNSISFKSSFENVFLDNCQISNVSFLSNQYNIHTLFLDNNDISDFTALQNLFNCKNISLRNNKLANIFPVHYFHSIERIDLRGNELGNKEYIRTQSFSRTNNPDEKDSIENLRKQMADYYYNNGQYDEALAYYYFDNTAHPEFFYMYLNKLLNTPTYLSFYINYYFSKLYHVLPRIDKEKKLLNENRSKILEKLQNANQNEVRKLLNILNGLDSQTNQYFGFLMDEFYYYEQNTANPYLDNEILFIKGGGINYSVERETLEQNLYYLKLLKINNSPFYFNLCSKILECLRMDFAYTNEEREKHAYYMDLIINIENRDIKKPDEKIIERQFQSTYKGNSSNNSISKNFEGSVLERIYVGFLYMVLFVSLFFVLYYTVVLIKH